MKTNNKVEKGFLKTVLVVILILIVSYFAFQAIRCYISLDRAMDRLKAYTVKTAELSYGSMTYIDEGQGDVLLSVHGLFGGYDQAYENVKSRHNKNRILAPSRFGYLSSDVKGDGSPKEQASAFKELLDYLEIDKVFILGTSAGGTPAIRFALDYPDRVRGLILFCSAMPLNEKPESYVEYQAPPAPFLADYPMYLISPLMPSLLGMPASTVEEILPIRERKEGVVIDGKITNPDMERNFDQYPIEDLQVPVLVLHSKDDSIASYEKVEKVQSRFENLTMVVFPDGGHMMVGHGQEIDNALDEFINSH